MNPLQFISFHRAKRVIEMLILRSRSPVFSSRINFLIWRKRSRRETGAVKERMRKKKHKMENKSFFLSFFTIRQRGWNVGTANKSSPCNRHHNPCKITQQRCVCARACVCVYFFLTIVLVGSWFSVPVLETVLEHTRTNIGSFHSKVNLNKVLIEGINHTHARMQ